MRDAKARAALLMEQEALVLGGADGGGGGGGCGSVRDKGTPSAVSRPASAPEAAAGEADAAASGGCGTIGGHAARSLNGLVVGRELSLGRHHAFEQSPRGGYPPRQQTPQLRRANTTGHTTPCTNFQSGSGGYEGGGCASPTLVSVHAARAPTAPLENADVAGGAPQVRTENV